MLRQCFAGCAEAQAAAGEPGRDLGAEDCGLDIETELVRVVRTGHASSGRRGCSSGLNAMKIACTLTADSDEPDDLETLRLLAQAPTLAKVLYELCNNDMFSNAVRRAASKHCLLHNIDFEEIYT